MLRMITRFIWQRGMDIPRQLEYYWHMEQR